MTNPTYNPYERTPYRSLYDVTDDDITQGLTVYLLEQGEILEVVGKEPGTQVPFIFQNTLLKTLEGTQSNAIVVNYMGDWATPGRGTFEGVRMSIRIYCDPLRDETGNSTPGADRETRLRVMKIHRIVNQFLHLEQREIWMGDVRTIDHTKLGTITIAPEPEGDGVMRGEAFYGISILGYR